MGAPPFNELQAVFVFQIILVLINARANYPALFLFITVKLRQLQEM